MTAPVINDFTITVATVNGSGSASSNTILAKSIFRMGVPVTPKNLFPSNIAGLPTWFIIRVSEQGYQARSGTNEVVVALNAETAAKDVASVDKGGVLFIDEKLARHVNRDDIAVFEVPFAELSKPHAPDPRLRKLLANMVYVGVCTHMLGLDHEVVMQAVASQFAGKDKVIRLNQDVVQVGIDHAAQNYDAALCPFKVATRELTRDKLFIEGNTATALGALMGGATFVGWYPITPSTSVCEEFIALCKKHRVVKGEQRFASVQAEDELASIGLVLGAGWAGARAFTTTSGPGISLMSEFVGFGYYAEIPSVIMDIQRVGPSTGMPTRTQQCDVQACYSLSHGDTGHIVLLPTGIEELYDFAMRSFDLAERYQTPVFLLSDLDMGMNYWMSGPLPYPTAGFDRGKVLDKAALDEVAEFARYKDVDGDGIPYRTLPGTRHPKAPYFTRGSGHTETAAYTEDSDEYKKVVDRIREKIEKSVRDTPAPVLEGDPACEVGILHYGSTAFATEEARDALAEKGLATKAMRIRALPLHPEVIEFVQSCRVVYVVEQNRDGQVADMVRLRVPGSASIIKKVLYYAGLPLAAGPIVEAIQADAREPAHV